MTLFHWESQYKRIPRTSISEKPWKYTRYKRKNHRKTWVSSLLYYRTKKRYRDMRWSCTFRTLKKYPSKYSHRRNRERTFTLLQKLSPMRMGMTYSWRREDLSCKDTIPTRRSGSNNKKRRSSLQSWISGISAGNSTMTNMRSLREN